MILLFTDFGYHGPYVGEMKAAIASVLGKDAPGQPVIDLMHDAPAFQPKLAAYLLAALVPNLPQKAIIVGVVDPGVGTARVPVVMEADTRGFIGPGNGLFEIVARRAKKVKQQRLLVPNRPISDSFHGRDIFAPAAAKWTQSGTQATAPLTETLPGGDWPDDLNQIIYMDHYGNAMTGRRADTLAPGTRIRIKDQILKEKRTFGEAEPGALFWYRNSAGLVEIAARETSAVERLGLALSDPIEIMD